LASAHVNAQLSRLIGKANYNYSAGAYTLQDTTVYYYSNPRGGDMTHPLLFDSSNMWQMSGGSLVMRLQVGKQYMDSVRRPDSQFLIDSAYETYFDTTTHAISTQYKYLVTYNPDLSARNVHCLTPNLTGGWDNVWADYYFYTSIGNLDHLIRQYGTGTFWGNDYNRTFTYNAYTNTNQQIDYDYTTGTFYITNDFDFTMRERDCLSSSEKHLWTGVDFSNPKDSFIYTYDTSTHFLISKLYLVDTSGSWVNDSLCLYSNFTSAGMPQTEIDERWNGASWDTVLRYTYTYNSYEQVTSRTGEVWTGSGWVRLQGQSLSYYYYEPYTPSGIANIAAAPSVQIFPNPAQNMLNLDISWNEAQPFTIGLYDITGKQVWSKTCAATRQYHTAIPTSDLPAATYILKVSGRGELVSKEVSISNY
jgi:hypothetical protein